MSITSPTDYNRALTTIRGMLTSGSIKVGDRLPSERDLARDLDVSRPVVREALRSLETIGAVQIRHGSGTYASAPQAAVLTELFQFVLSNQTDILETRAAIELHAIRLACVRATQSDYDALAAALSRIVETMGDAEAGGLADFQFHTAIVRASQSPSMLAVYMAIAEVLQRSHFGRRAQILKVPGIDDYLIEHHRRIFHAVVERDAEKAFALLSEHFQIGADFMRRAVLVSSVAQQPAGPA